MARIFLVMIFTFVASSALAKGHSRIELEYNSQRPGGDYTHFIVSNARECAEECERSSRCQAFDFYKSDNSCWLKSRAYSARYYAGVVSGFKRADYSGKSTVQKTNIELSYDTQRPGGDYTRFQAQSAQQCSRRCQQESRCVAFDYTTSDYFCYLKSWEPPARKYRGIISGVKRRYYPQVRSVQEALIQQHYNPGGADGLLGRKTRIALENYQRDHHLFVSGRIDDATLVSLGLLEKTEDVSRSSPPEGSTQEISGENDTEDLPLYIKTVGVTYLQSADNIYADVLVKIPADTLLQVFEQNGEWYKVPYQNHVGYVLVESVQKQ